MQYEVEPMRQAGQRYTKQTIKQIAKEAPSLEAHSSRSRGRRLAPCRPRNLSVSQHFRVLPCCIHGEPQEPYTAHVSVCPTNGHGQDAQSLYREGRHTCRQNMAPGRSCLRDSYHIVARTSPRWPSWNIMMRLQRPQVKAQPLEHAPSSTEAMHIIGDTRLSRLVGTSLRWLSMPASCTVDHCPQSITADAGQASAHP